MAKHKKICLILLILFIGNFIFRWSLISKGPYHSDNLYFAVQAENILKTQKMHYLHGPGLPLTAIMGAVFIGLSKLFGNTDIIFSVNFMSVLLSALCIPLFFILLNQLFDQYAAFAGSLVLSLNTLFLALSEFGNSHIPATLLLIVGLIYLVSYFQTTAYSKLLLAGLFFGLMGACRQQEIVPMGISLVLIFGLDALINKKMQSFKNLIVIGLVMASTLFLFYLPAMLDKSRLPVTTKASSMYFEIIADTVQRISWIQFRSIFNWIFNSVSIVGCLAVIGGYWFMWNKKRIWFYRFFCLFIVPILLYGIFWHSSPRIYLQSVIIVIIPLSYLFTVLAARNKKYYFVGLIILLISLCGSLNTHYATIKFRHDHELLPDFYRWIALVTEPGARIIERDHSLFLRFYANREPLSTPVTLFSAESDKLKEFNATIQNQLTQGVPVYITYTGMTGYPSQFKFKEYMYKNFDLKHVGDFNIEEWYSGVLYHSVLRNSLYRINALKQ